MTWKKTTLEYWVPDWAWCEMPNPGKKTKTGERCRFCQEIKKRGGATTFRCILHNKDLYVRGGSVVRCGICTGFDKNASKLEAPPIAKVKDVGLFKCVKRSLKEYKKCYQKARKEGLPEYMALDQASEEVLQQWN